jgi:hypothetical protein
MLNKARRDPVHGSKALIAMIDIYVNPTGGVLGGDALDSSSGDTMANGSGSKADYRDLTLSTAETLIKVRTSIQNSLKSFAKTHRLFLNILGSQCKIK